MELDNPEKVLSVVRAYLKFTNKTTDELCRALGHTPRHSNGEPTPEYRRIDAILAGVDGIYSRTYTAVPKSTLYSARPLKPTPEPPPKLPAKNPRLGRKHSQTVRKLRLAMENISSLETLSIRQFVKFAGVPQSTIGNINYKAIKAEIENALDAEEKRRKLAG